jgi:hypothetical protein
MSFFLNGFKILRKSKKNKDIKRKTLIVAHKGLQIGQGKSKSDLIIVKNGYKIKSQGQRKSKSNPTEQWIHKLK